MAKKTGLLLNLIPGSPGFIEVSITKSGIETFRLDSSLESKAILLVDKRVEIRIENGKVDAIEALK